MVKKKENLKKQSVLFRNVYIDTPYRVVLGLLAIILLTAITTLSFRWGVQLETINSIYYNEKSDLDYKVYLKENNYFQEKYLGKDRQYIAGLIDYISADFKYELNASNSFDYQYRYWVTATLVAKEKGENSKVVYERDFSLIEPKTFELKDSNNFNINENVEIDYDYFNDIMNSFKKDYALSLDSNLIVKLHVDLLGNAENIKQDITSNQVMEVSIPLSEQTINISMDYNKINNYEVIEEVSNTEVINKFLFIICIISLVLDVIVVIEYVRFLERIKQHSDAYTKKLNRILKEYDRAIVKTRKMPDVDDLKVIEVESFEELLDARENLERPILHIDVHPGQKSCFLIINQKEVFKFILKASDLEKEEKKDK